MKQFMNWLKEEDGQGMVEYALIIALISIAAVAIFTPLGGKILGAFTQANDAMPE